MPKITGRVTGLTSYTEEGRTDIILALSRILLIGVSILFPIAVLRVTYIMFDFWITFVVLILMLVTRRIMGPVDLVAIDELLARIFPSIRSAVRTGLIPVRDFRVMTDTGKEYGCLLKGDLSGSGIIVGDNVSVEGNLRDGTFMVQSGCNRTTGAVLCPRHIHTGAILLFSCLISGFTAMFLLGVFDDFICNVTEMALMVDAGQ